MAKLLVLAALVLGACALDSEPEPGEHEEAADLEPFDDGKADGVSATFNQNNVVDDALFTGDMDVADVQAFLEDTPYGTRSWLASYKINGVPASQRIVDAARAERIHPLMLLVRMQVEASLVSKTATPSQTRINAALGCGCPDGGGCSAAYRGLDAQLTCGAHVLRRWYDGSSEGTGQWKKGQARRTLDPRTVTPANHATASLYAYTPWVLVGRGGNWLVWNVSKKYVKYAEDQGLIPSTP
ncbi:MAG: hypothetical protein JNL83_07755 [Myxococcales bacterium]|nr:hypothetical protein [Myxococcales bacterium]